MQDERRLGGDPLEQAAVLAGHREHAGGAAAVEQGNELEAAVGASPRPRSASKAISSSTGPSKSRRRASTPKRSRSSAGRYSAPGGGVLADVAQDVPDLQRDAEVVRERGAGGPVGAVEDAEREPPDRARDAAAVELELVERVVPVAAHVGLGAVDEVAERVERDREAAGGVGDARRTPDRCSRTGSGQAARSPRAPRASRPRGASRRRCRRSGARGRRSRTARRAGPAGAAACRRRSSSPSPGRRGGSARRPAPLRSRHPLRR